MKIFYGDLLTPSYHLRGLGYLRRLFLNNEYSYMCKNLMAHISTGFEVVFSLYMSSIISFDIIYGTSFNWNIRYYYNWQSWLCLKYLNTNEVVLSLNTIEAAAQHQAAWPADFQLNLFYKIPCYCYFNKIQAMPSYQLRRYFQSSW